MRGEDLQQHELFSYGSLEERIPGSHPLRPIRAMVDEALKDLSNRFDEIYPEDGRKSIPPERLLRALLLQMLYSIRSERMLMEQMEYNLLFRWFVGMSADEPVWHPTVFTKNRDRLRLCHRVRVLWRSQDAHPVEGRGAARLGEPVACLARC